MSDTAKMALAPLGSASDYYSEWEFRMLTLLRSKECENSVATWQNMIPPPGKVQRTQWKSLSSQDATSVAGNRTTKEARPTTAATPGTPDTNATFEETTTTGRRTVMVSRT